ncbi:transposase (plasmid) [Pantoea sp. BJ2]|uniref:Transposase n=1 Tax=Pantoea sp. BJ2 TaxID=3141322 RepID=A0AAU7U550_9GAMM
MSKSRRANRVNLSTSFAYPEDIQRRIYTTNPIESLNSVFRQAFKTKCVPGG